MSDAGLDGLVDERVRVDVEVGANAGVKVGSLVAGMIAGADCIDDMDLLRHGALPDVFAGVRAPSTLGSFLRRWIMATCASLVRCTGSCWPGSRPARRCCPAPTRWRSSMPFDIDDENIAWIDSGHVGRLTALRPFADAPFYLGNVIAPTSFSPNGDGRGDVWAMAFPVSKALPSCSVTIYRGRTAVRVLNCTNGNGMAFAAWNGRTASGAALPVGRYTIRVNGRDADGWLRHYDQQLKPVTFWVDKTT